LPRKGLLGKLHDKELGPKTISNVVDTGKMEVASLKANGDEVYGRTWDNQYIDPHSK
jgi:hypothetical protein